MAEQQSANAAKRLTYGIASPSDHHATDASFNTSTKAGLEAWIYWYYCQKGFRYDGTYKSLKALKEYLFALDTVHSKTKIQQAIRP